MGPEQATWGLDISNFVLEKKHKNVVDLATDYGISNSMTWGMFCLWWRIAFGVLEEHYSKPH